MNNKSTIKILQILNLYDIFVTKENITKNDRLEPAWLYDIKYHNVKPCF